MRIKLLIATADVDYANHMSNILAEKYADDFEVSVCTSSERFRDLLTANRYDAALLEAAFIESANLSAIRLPVLLADSLVAVSGAAESLRRVNKYQRISSIAGKVMEYFAEISGGIGGFGGKRARITVVWSPAGGTGKTTVALSYAASRVSAGRQAVYLNLESFSSVSVYFRESGPSITRLFEKLESNAAMFQKGIRQLDTGSGIAYFCGPENYDDVNILSSEDIEKLVSACADDADDLIIDLSDHCDQRNQKILCMADAALLVCDPSPASQVKLGQFINQHSTFGQIRANAVLVNNKGARFAEPNLPKSIQLPLVPAADPVSVFKTLSSARFDW